LISREGTQAEAGVKSIREVMFMARTRRWSRHVTETSNSLDLEDGVFTKDSPSEIALSLQRSAERSQRRGTVDV